MPAWEVIYTHKTGTVPLVGDTLTYTYSIGNTSTGTVSSVLGNGAYLNSALVLNIVGATFPMIGSDLTKSGWSAEVVSIEETISAGVAILMRSNVMDVQPATPNGLYLLGEDSDELETESGDFLEIQYKTEGISLSPNPFSSDDPHGPILQAWNGTEYIQRPIKLWSGSFTSPGLIAWNNSVWAITKVDDPI